MPKENLIAAIVNSDSEKPAANPLAAAPRNSEAMSQVVAVAADIAVAIDGQLAEIERIKDRIESEETARFAGLDHLDQTDRDNLAAAQVKKRWDMVIADKAAIPAAYRTQSEALAATLAKAESALALYPNPMAMLNARGYENSEATERYKSLLRNASLPELQQARLYALANPGDVAFAAALYQTVSTIPGPRRKGLNFEPTDFAAEVVGFEHSKLTRAVDAIRAVASERAIRWRAMTGGHTALSNIQLGLAKRRAGLPTGRLNIEYEADADESNV